uniref:Leucine rich repeat containing 24 n=1 Tax=Equus asinus TaxID=9793 RepID=A0A9L0JXU6_EQUAS
MWLACGALRAWARSPGARACGGSGGVPYTQGQSPEPRTREYFYYVDHQGQVGWGRGLCRPGKGRRECPGRAGPGEGPRGGGARGRSPPRGRGWRRARGAGLERVPPEGAGPEGGPPRGRGWRRARGTGPESVAPEGAGPEEGPSRGRGLEECRRNGAGESAPRGGGAGGRSQRGRAGGVGGVSKVSESDSTELRGQSTASPVPPRLLWKTWPGHPAYPGGGKSGRRRGSGGVSD